MRRSGRLVSIISAIFVIMTIFFTINTNAIQIKKSTSKNFIIIDIKDNTNYNSIQKAINDANPGSTLYIKNGEYNEIIDINKKISLVGEDKKSTLINPISEKNKYAVRLGAQSIKIDNMGIKNRAPGLYSTAIKIIKDSCEIKNCNIYETPVGIAVWSCKNIINNCDFRNCEDEGIALLGWKDHECNYNTIINCNFYENCDGIEMQYSSYNLIKDCIFSKNSHSGIDAIASSNNYNKIINCNIIQNNVNGIYFSSSSNNEIIDCTIKDNNNGNIIMNGKSSNNKVSFSNSNDETNNQNMIYDFLNKIKDFKNNKISKILSSINF